MYLERLEKGKEGNPNRSNRSLVLCRGYIGDCLFAGSLAEKLWNQEKEKPDFMIPLIQPLYLLQQNPFINEVFGPTQVLNAADYKRIIEISEVDQSHPVTLQFQRIAGITDPSLEYNVYTVPEFDAYFRQEVRHMREMKGQKIIAWQRNWEYKAYQCTAETLEQGIGAPHRDIDAIIKDLEKDYILISMGFDRNVTQYAPEAHNADLFARTASLIKACDLFIGSEGGLSNLAAGVGTKCIITTDFIAQNYGPNGRVKKIPSPQMGPAVYYPNRGHVHLDPCIKDEDIANEIRKALA